MMPMPILMMPCRFDMLPPLPPLPLRHMLMFDDAAITPPTASIDVITAYAIDILRHFAFAPPAIAAFYLFSLISAAFHASPFIHFAIIFHYADTLFRYYADTLMIRRH